MNPVFEEILNPYLPNPPVKVTLPTPESVEEALLETAPF